MGAAREHGIVDAITDAGVHAMADTAYQGGDSTRHRPSASQKEVNTAPARQRGRRERANAQLES